MLRCRIGRERYAFIVLLACLDKIFTVLSIAYGIACEHAHTDCAFFWLSCILEPNPSFRVVRSSAKKW